MMGGIASIIMGVLAAIVAATFLHALIVIVVLAFRRPRPRPSPPRGDLPPVTWFRPLKSDVRDLASKLTQFAEALPAGDQVLLGVDPGSHAAAIAWKLAERFGDSVRVVECRRRVAKNPKVSKLQQMAPAALHERWIVVDSEATIDPEFAGRFRSEWEDGHADADVLTAGYRFTGAASFQQSLDAMSTVLTLWPGLELVRAFGTVRFTLGACTAVRREDLDALGGWAALGDELAEDYWLGTRLCRLGRSVQLSESVITLDADSMTFAEYWRHQLRVATTYRAVRPLGTAGMILTRGVTAGVLASFIHPLPGLLLFSLALVVRVALAESIAATRGLPLKNPAGIIIVSDVIETVAWMRAWFARSVWWGGRARRITWRGRLRD